MERIAVQSREIALVGYESSTSTLEITFRRGRVYHYFEVPSDIHRNLLEAPSAGTFFAEQIKDKFTYKKIN